MTAKNIYRIKSQFLMYCLCGGIGVLSDVISYYCVISNGNNYQLANVVGYSIGTIVSFYLNRKLTFRVKTKVKTRLFIFIAVAMIGYSMSAIILGILIEIIHVDSMLSKVIVLPIIVLIQYAINKKITFS